MKTNAEGPTNSRNTQLNPNHENEFFNTRSTPDQLILEIIKKMPNESARANAITSFNSIKYPAMRSPEPTFQNILSNKSFPETISL
jgi:hypothetical protein